MTELDEKSNVKISIFGLILGPMYNCQLVTIVTLSKNRKGYRKDYLRALFWIFIRQYGYGKYARV